MWQADRVTRAIGYGLLVLAAVLLSLLVLLLISLVAWPGAW